MASDDDIIRDRLSRWTRKLAEYRSSDSYESRYTYRSVVSPDGIFGDGVGAIVQDTVAKAVLIRALRREGFLHLADRVNEFVALAVCDFATRVIDDSMYEGLATVLGVPDLFAGGAARSRLQRALKDASLFPITQNVDGDNEFILSLRRFVPAYPMSDEHLREEVLRLLPRFAPNWIARNRAFDIDAFRIELGHHLDVAPSKRAEMIEPFCDLFLQVRRLVMFASRLDAFDAMTLGEFTAKYSRAHGATPLAGQPLQLSAIWEQVRGVMGVADGTVRTTVHGLLGYLRRNDVELMPDGSPRVPELELWPPLEIPWGVYRRPNGASLLVSNELAHFDRTLADQLLRANPPQDGASLVQGSRSQWIVAHWPFLISGGGRGALLQSPNAECYVCRVSTREFYPLYGLEKHHRHFVLLDGDGHASQLNPYYVWRLVERDEGPRMCPVIVLPLNDDARPLKILRGERLLLDMEWGSGYTPLLAEVPPDAHLRLVWPEGEQSLRLRFPEYTLFVPSARPTEWEAVSPHAELAQFVGKLFVVGPADARWTGEGCRFSEARRLGQGWDAWRIWEVTREGRSRSVRIGTLARTLWEWERTAFAEVVVAGADLDSGGIVYDDPSGICVRVRGDLGSMSTDADPLTIHLREAGRHVELRVPSGSAAVNWVIEGPKLLESLGASQAFARRWSIDLEVPDGVWNAGPTQIIFYQAPSFSLHNTPALRPGQTHIVIELKIPALSDALLEYGHPNGQWTRVDLTAERCSIEVPVTAELLDSQLISLPVRLWGRVFPGAIKTVVAVTGLAVRTESKTQVTCSAEYRGEFVADSGVELQALGLKGDDEIQVTFANPAAVSPICLDVTHSGARLEPDQLLHKNTDCDIRFRAGSQFPWQRLGKVTLQRRPHVSALSATVTAARVEVSVAWSLPIGDELEIVLRDATGDELDDLLVQGSGGFAKERFWLELPVEITLGSAAVIVRTRCGTELMKCGLEPVQTLESADHKAEAFCAAVRAARMGKSVPFDGPLSAALQKLCIEGYSRLAAFCYLRALLAVVQCLPLRTIALQEILRMLELLRSVGDLKWWETGEALQQIESLVGWVNAETKEDKHVARAAALVALSAVAHDPQGRCEPELRRRGLCLLADPTVLSELNESHKPFQSISAKEIVALIEPQLMRLTSRLWERLGRFLRSLGADSAAALAAQVEAGEREGQTPLSLAMFGVVLALCRTGERHFGSRFLARAVESVRSAMGIDAFFDAYLPAGNVRQLLGSFSPEQELTPVELFGEWSRGCRFDLWSDLAVPDSLRIAGKEYLLAERELIRERAGQYLLGAVSHLRAVSLSSPWSDLADVLYPLILLRAGRVSEFLANVSSAVRPNSTAGAWAQLDQIVEMLCATTQPPRCVGMKGLGSVSPRDDDRLLDAALSGGVSEYLAAARSCWVSAWIGWRRTSRSGMSGAETRLLYDQAFQLLGRVPYADPQLQEEIETAKPGVWNG